VGELICLHYCTTSVAFASNSAVALWLHTKVSSVVMASRLGFVHRISLDV
jgi:hypothetical protein